MDAAFFIGLALVIIQMFTGPIVDPNDEGAPIVEYEEHTQETED